MMTRIAIALGTRPEAIKLAPVVAAFRANSDRFHTTVLSTGQHREILRQVLAAFDLAPDIDLDLMRPDQSLSDLTSRILTALTLELRRIKPDLLLVQGDTTTAFAASLAAFYLRIPVAHVEAGLRSHDLENPFPEEANRRLVSALAQVHLCPTPAAAENLVQENVPASNIAVTGNTVVDALQHIAALPAPALPAPFSFLNDQPRKYRLMLVTTHRRESQGKDMAQICRAIAALVEDLPDLVVAIPVHPNPRVRQVINDHLASIPRVHLLSPLDYFSFIHLMRVSDIILTDSGGVQEEAPTFKVPVLVVRKITERPEAMWNGQSIVVGTDQDRIRNTTLQVLSDTALRQRMQKATNPFGDGVASKRIVLAIQRWIERKDVLLAPDEAFHSSVSPSSARGY